LRERERTNPKHLFRHQSSMSSSSIKTVIWFAWKCYKRMLLVPYYLASIGNEYIDMNKDKKRVSFTQKLYSLSFYARNFSWRKMLLGRNAFTVRIQYLKGPSQPNCFGVVSSSSSSCLFPTETSVQVRMIVIVSVLIIDSSFLLFLWLGLFCRRNYEVIIYVALWNNR
jgi:hypothetical protein